MRTIHEVADFASSVIESMEWAFPADRVLTLLRPELDAALTTYASIDPGTLEGEVIGPGCREEALAFALGWWRASPADSPLFVMVEHQRMGVSTGPSLYGGPAGWDRAPARDLIKTLGDSEHLALMPLNADELGVSALSFARPRREFTAAELELLTSLQPVLQAVARHAMHLGEWRRQLQRAQLSAPGVVIEAGLTPREITVLQLMAQGLTSFSIARRLACSSRTVEKHVANLYRKLEVNDRVSAVIRAQQRGLVAVPARPHRVDHLAVDGVRPSDR